MHIFVAYLIMPTIDLGTFFFPSNRRVNFITPLIYSQNRVFLDTPLTQLSRKVTQDIWLLHNTIVWMPTDSVVRQNYINCQGQQNIVNRQPGLIFIICQYNNIMKASAKPKANRLTSVMAKMFFHNTQLAINSSLVEWDLFQLEVPRSTLYLVVKYG